MVSIVVADDHKIVREGLVKLLETREDFEVIGEASDGEEAVNLVLEKEPDIVLMDINMPKLGGIEATAAEAGRTFFSFPHKKHASCAVVAVVAVTFVAVGGGLGSGTGEGEIWQLLAGLLVVGLLVESLLAWRFGRR